MINNRQSSKLQAAEMKFLRSALQKTKKDKIRNDRIREEMRVEKSLDLRIRESRLRWYGHVRRMEESRTAKKWLDKEIQGKRSRGRPCKRWKEQVAEDCTVKGWDKEVLDREEKWKDKKEWRRLIHTRATGVENR